MHELDVSHHMRTVARTLESTVMEVFKAACCQHAVLQQFICRLESLSRWHFDGEVRTLILKVMEFSKCRPLDTAEAANVNEGPCSSKRSPSFCFLLKFLINMSLHI